MLVFYMIKRNHFILHTELKNAPNKFFLAYILNNYIRKFGLYSCPIERFREGNKMQA